jgi:salicylate hydroxylase
MALHARAIQLGVQFFLSEKVKDIDLDTTTVVTAAGNTYSGDLIVAADGLWSRCREVYMGRKDEPLPTGDLAFRIVLNAADIENQELREWIRNPEVHFWFGPKCHVVGYSLKGGEQFNLVLLCPDDLPKGTARQAGSLDEMRKLFVGWDPVLTRFLACVKSVDKWKLMHRAEMKSWVSDGNNLIFMGDACHPMLPYLAQGASSSIEDGAVLGLVLENITSKQHLPGRLKIYERLRKQRGEAIARETFKQV